MIKQYAFQAFEVDCDERVSGECDSGQDITGQSWEDMIFSLKADGWRIFKDENGEWKHICKFH